MARYKCRVKVSRDNGLPNKRDTPVKTALSRRDKCKRILLNKYYEAIAEEPEVEDVPPVKLTMTGIKPVHCKSVLRSSRPGFAENPRGKVTSPAAPANMKVNGYQGSLAGNPTIKVTPDTFKGGEIRVKEEEQNLAVTPESITSSIMESDATFSSDDDEEDCYSSASTDSSSLPSPEIFRRESYVETLTLPIKDKLLGVHLDIKNSTLLDGSHAENIHMYPPPNLSTIIVDSHLIKPLSADASAILAVKNSEIREPEVKTKIATDSFKSDIPFKWKTPPKVTNRRPILCKKKVWFKSPIIAETFKGKHNPAARVTIDDNREPVQTSSPAEQIMPDADTCPTGLISSTEEALQLKVLLERPVKSSQEKASFFDFVTNSDRNAFFQSMRERCVKLRSAPLFPLRAAKPHKQLSCDI